MHDKYSYYDDETVAAEPEKDERLTALELVVRLEREHDWAARDAKERTQKANAIHTELMNARIHLHKLLGVTENSGAKAVAVER